MRANAISTSNSIQNCFNHGVITIEGKNGNCFSSIMAPQCKNCYTTKNIIIENIDKSFYILPDCYSFGENSRFCYIPDDFYIEIEGGTPINDMTEQSFCDLLNAIIILLDNKELRNWIQGPDLYPIVTDHKNEEPDMGISEIEINPTDNSTGIYLLNGQKVDSISKLPKGSIYIVNGTKYLKFSN